MWLQRSATPRSRGTSGPYVDSEPGCSEVFSAWVESSRWGVPGACCTGQFGPSRSRRFLASSSACRLATACSWLIALGLGARGFGGLRTGAWAAGEGWRGSTTGADGIFQLCSRISRGAGVRSTFGAGAGAIVRAGLATTADLAAARFTLACLADVFSFTGDFGVAVLRGAAFFTTFRTGLLAAFRAGFFAAPRLTALPAAFFGAAFLAAGRFLGADFLPACLVDLRARLIAMS